jgi:hypothetical protein
LEPKGFLLSLGIGNSVASERRRGLALTLDCGGNEGQGFFSPQYTIRHSHNSADGHVTDFDLGKLQSWTLESTIS